MHRPRIGPKVAQEAWDGFAPFSRVSPRPALLLVKAALFPSHPARPLLCVSWSHVGQVPALAGSLCGLRLVGVFASVPPQENDPRRRRGDEPWAVPSFISCGIPYVCR